MRVTEKGQVTIPKELRDALGIGAGTEVEFERRKDVIVVRKLGVPFQPELAMGAIGEGGVRVLNEEVVRLARLTPEEIAAVERRERTEAERRAQLFRGGRPAVPLAGRTVIVVDDGLATGSTARAALAVALAQGARRTLLAVPVAPRDTVAQFEREGHEVICVQTPEPFYAVGQWYSDFRQTTDEEVVRLLHESDSWQASRAVDDPPPPERDQETEISAGNVRLGGNLSVPASATGIAVFAHGSGSGRHSPRNRSVARALNAAGFATLLFDLLTDDEAMDRANVFNIELLAERLTAATRWLETQPEASLSIGYFGASTGAAAALWAAANAHSPVRAIVSRGGRPDLAMPRLHEVRAPTLLIVGGLDDIVIQMNAAAEERLRVPHELVVVPGASHLFEEPGTLEAVAELAIEWFGKYLGGSSG